MRIALVVCALGAHAAGAAETDGLALAGFEPASSRQLKAQLELLPAGTAAVVGLVVDGRETGYLQAYRFDGELLLPAEALLQQFEVLAVLEGDTLVLTTPGGELRATPADFVLIDNELYVRDRFISEVLGGDWRFDGADYAIKVALPWSLGGRVDRRGRRDRAERRLDHRPPLVGLTQSRIDQSLYWNRQTTRTQTDALLQGRLAGGIFRADLAHLEEFGTYAREYYWLRDFEKTQALIGYRPISINELLPAGNATGVQLLHNSSGLNFEPWRDRSASNYVRRLGLDTARLQGKAQPGAVVELVVDDRVLARQRVLLDGSYEFANIARPHQRFQDVKVNVLDPQTYVVLDTQDHSTTPSDLLLARGQSLSFLSVGVQDEPLFGARNGARIGQGGSGNSTNGFAGSALVRYGLGKRFTVQAGGQTGDQTYALAGVSAGLGQHWVASVSVADQSGSRAVSADLAGRGKRWYSDLRLVRRAAGYAAASSSRYVDWRSEWQASRRFTLGAYGRDTNNVSFLLPGVSWRFNRRHALRLWPDANGDYVFDLRSDFRQRDFFELRAQKNYWDASYRWFSRQGLEWFGGVQKNRDALALATAGVQWYPRVRDNRSFVRASLLGNAEEFGYRLHWDTPLWFGLYSSLEVRDEPARERLSNLSIGSGLVGIDPFEDDTNLRSSGLQALWRVSLDLAFVGGRPLPARNRFTRTRFGSIAGRLLLAGINPSAQNRSMGRIQRVAIEMDGVVRHAPVQNGRYYLGNLAPGDYHVRLAADHLPMALSPLDAGVFVRVAEAATTQVNFAVRAEYGVMGRILDSAGRGIPDAQVVVLDSGGVRSASGVSDSAGYYRISGLPPGDYELRATYTGSLANVRSTRLFSIEADFLFDLDVQIALDLALAGSTAIAPD